MPGDVPKKVEDIVKALKRENPGWEEEKYWKIAWSTYNKMSENIYIGDYAYLSEGSPKHFNKIKKFGEDVDRIIQKTDNPLGRGFVGASATEDEVFAQIDYHKEKVSYQIHWVGSNKVEVWFFLNKKLKGKDTAKMNAAAVADLMIDLLSLGFDSMGWAYESTLSEASYKQGQKVNFKDVLYKAPSKNGETTFVIVARDTTGMRGSQDKFLMLDLDKSGRVILNHGSHPSLEGAKKFAKNNGLTESDPVLGWKSKQKKKRKVLPSDPPILPQDTEEETELMETRMSAAAIELLDVLKTKFGKGVHSLTDVARKMRPATHFKNIMRGAEILYANGEVEYDGVNISLAESVGRDFGIGYKDDIVKFFVKNPYPDDRQVHNFAGELGLSHEELEREIYALLTDLLQGR